MNASPIDSTQRMYARLAGVMYLSNYATSVFGALAPARITGSGDFADRARRVIASEHLYRTALASMVVGWVLIVLLAFSLYVTLRPVNKRLAQLALFLELCQAAVGAVTVIFSFVVLGIYTGQPTGTFSNEQLQGLAGTVQGASLSGFNISMTFLGVGSTLFFYLFYKSGYIPRALAGLGVVGSIVMVVVSLSILISPENAAQLQYGWAPIGLAEVGTALWLTGVGIRPPRTMAGDLAAA